MDKDVWQDYFDDSPDSDSGRLDEGLSVSVRRRLWLAGMLIGVGLAVNYVSVRFWSSVVGSGLGIGMLSTGWMIVGVVVGRVTMDEEH